MSTLETSKLVLTDIQIPFWRMIIIILKWTLASIPALIIMMLIMMTVSGLIIGAADYIGFLPAFPDMHGTL